MLKMALLHVLVVYFNIYPPLRLPRLRRCQPPPREALFTTQAWERSLNYFSFRNQILFLQGESEQAAGSWPAQRWIRHRLFMSLWPDKAIIQRPLPVYALRRLITAKLREKNPSKTL